MGREVKRVPLDFDWPVGKTWEGYLNPHHEARSDCPACGGTGYNPATRQIADDWYDFAQTGRRWCDDITQDEVDQLIKENRLWDFWREFVPGEGWRDKDPKPEVTAAQVNAWNKRGGIMGHDAINRMICVERRARRLGVYGHCPECRGTGDLWDPPEAEAQAENWEPTEPPEGEGWQLWETVSEGSPITPVYSTDENLIDHMCQPNDRSRGPWDKGWPRNVAEEFVKKHGWAPSGVKVDGEIVDGVTGVTVWGKEVEE